METATTSQTPSSGAAKTRSLKDDLTSALPEGFRCQIRYIRSQSKPCDPLFSPPQGTEPEKTHLASHFLTVSIKSSAGSEDALVLGIEALVYTTKHLTTIFVSKADSTGYLPQLRPSPIRTIATTFLNWLSARERQRHPNRKLVISLFARSQSQYLFPGSAENATKHVLDDRQLIKWWARVLDPIVPQTDENSNGSGSADPEYAGYITIPGYSKTELRPFMPSTNPASHWHAGDPLLEFAETREISIAAPPRCLLPRFPDDPKARFMLDLDGEMGIHEDLVTISPSKRKGGQWNSIRSLDRFWEAMEFRQECSSGRVVGFLWLVMRPKETEELSLHTIDEHDSQETSQESSLGALVNDAVSLSTKNASIISSPTKKRRKPLSGPIIPRQPRLKSGSSSQSVTSDINGTSSAATEGDGLMLSKEGYHKAMQKLLHLDFSDLMVAVQSTSKWTSEVSSICGIKNDWSLEILGAAKLGVSTNSNCNGNSQVNDLGGMIRKKRKADTQDPAPEPAKDTAPGVNVLGAGMIRKKPKPTPV